MRKSKETMVPLKAVQEMMDIYSAWLAVIFRRLGVGEYRFAAKDISEGLGELSFSASRVGDEYVIRLTPKDGQEGTNEVDTTKV